MFLITNLTIDIASILSTAHREDGAVATFMGTVRDHSGGRSVTALQYSVYAPMALKSFEQIADEVKAKWGVTHLSIVHRFGRLKVGEISVAVTAGSPHRREALAACAYAIDRIKTISPIWKKEFYNDLEGIWVEGCDASPRENAHVHAY